MTIFQAGADEGGEERVRRQGFGFEFGMELAAYEPGVIGGFDYFYVDAVSGVRPVMRKPARVSVSSYSQLNS